MHSRQPLPRPSPDSANLAAYLALTIFTARTTSPTYLLLITYDPLVSLQLAPLLPLVLRVGFRSRDCSRDHICIQAA